MSKIFVIPDVHLKPWMLEEAERLMEKEKYDKIVFIGDLVDDWYQQNNLKLYDATFAAFERLVEKYKNKFYWCFGNHDISYVWEADETGYSPLAREMIVRRTFEIKKMMEEGHYGFIFRFDNALFSHAGLSKSFVEMSIEDEHIDKGVEHIIEIINKMWKRDLWIDSSPIWVRPQLEAYVSMYPEMLQVVGHTPVCKAYSENGFLSVDTFSTRSNKVPIGDQTFVWVDSETLEWGVINT